MALTDLIIIYLACGAPFGVYKLTKGRNFSGRYLFVVICSILLWPIVGFRFLRSRAINAPIPLPAEQLIREIEDRYLQSAPPSAVFAFRETCSRFIGLARAAAEPLGTGFKHELFKISGHPSPEIATSVLLRRDRDHLKHHVDLAYLEFRALISDLDLYKADTAKIDEFAASHLAAAAVEPSPFALSSSRPISKEVPSRQVRAL